MRFIQKSHLKAIFSNRTLHNVAYVSGGFGLGKAGILVAMILLARIYPEEGQVFGKISYALAVTAFAASCFFYIDIISVRSFISKIQERRHIIGSILLYRLLLATAIYLLLAVVVWFISPTKEERNLILAFGARLFPLALFVGWYFQAVKKMLWFSLGLFLQSWGYTLCIILFASSTTPALQVPLWLLLAFGFSAILLYSIMVRTEGVVSFRVDIPFWKKFTSSIAFLAGADLVYLLYMQGSVLVLKTLKGYELAGSFNAIYVLFCGVVFLLCSIPTALFPRFVEEVKNGDPKTIHLLFGRSLFYMFFLVLPIAVGGALCANDLISLVYKGKYANVVPCFQILMINVAIMSINTIQNRGLIAAGRERTVALIHVIMGVVGITMNILLVKYMGLVGSSIALVCAEVLAIILMTISFVRLWKVYFWRYLGWPIVPTAAMALAVAAFNSSGLAVKVGVGACVYLLTCGMIFGFGLCKVPEPRA